MRSSRDDDLLNVDNENSLSELTETGPRQAPGDQNDEIGVVFAVGWQAYGRFGSDFNGQNCKVPVLVEGLGKVFPQKLL